MSDVSAITRPEFPPLLTGQACDQGDDPFDIALALVKTDFEPGTVVYAEDDRRFAAALILAPDRPLQQSAGALFTVALGLSDAIGALAPPEVACHLEWPDRIRINGALAGLLRMAAPTTDPEAEPDWLVIAADIAIAPRLSESGHDTEHTTLHDEGCGEVTTPALIESFAHHLMSRLHVFITDGMGPIHTEYMTKLHGRDADVTYPEAGQISGIDEHGGLILKTDGGTKLIPLTSILETAP